MFVQGRLNYKTSPCFFHCRVLPTFFTYFADKYFNIKIKFKSISLLNATIENISVKCAGYEIVSVEGCLRHEIKICIHKLKLS